MEPASHQQLEPKPPGLSPHPHPTSGNFAGYLSISFCPSWVEDCSWGPIPGTSCPSAHGSAH